MPLVGKVLNAPKNPDSGSSLHFVQDFHVVQHRSIVVELELKTV